MNASWVTLVVVSTLCSVAIGPAASTARAQEHVAASAQLRVPAVFDVRAISLGSARRVADRRLEMTQEITTAANVDYLMTVVAGPDLSRLEAEGLHVSVLTPSGGFVPLRVGIPVTAGRGRRGMASLSSVTIRVDGVGKKAGARSEGVAEEIMRMLELRPAATLE